MKMPKKVVRQTSWDMVFCITAKSHSLQNSPWNLCPSHVTYKKPFVFCGIFLIAFFYRNLLRPMISEALEFGRLAYYSIRRKHGIGTAILNHWYIHDIFFHFHDVWRLLIHSPAKRVIYRAFYPGVIKWSWYLLAYFEVTSAAVQPISCLFIHAARALMTMKDNGLIKMGRRVKEKMWFLKSCNGRSAREIAVGLFRECEKDTNWDLGSYALLTEATLKRHI